MIRRSRLIRWAEVACVVGLLCSLCLIWAARLHRNGTLLDDAKENIEGLLNLDAPFTKNSPFRTYRAKGLRRGLDLIQHPQNLNSGKPELLYALCGINPRGPFPILALSWLDLGDHVRGLRFSNAHGDQTDVIPTEARTQLSEKEVTLGKGYALRDYVYRLNWMPAHSSPAIKELPDCIELMLPREFDDETSQVSLITTNGEATDAVPLWNTSAGTEPATTRTTVMQENPLPADDERLLTMPHLSRKPG